MRKIFLAYVFFFLLSSTFALSADDKFVLVIDAGHGGRDIGATRGIYKEKSINLAVALALGRLVESNMKDVKVVYTRKSDEFVNLYKRSQIANKADANLFISIHTNSTAARTTSAEGADTYILGLARTDENLAVAKRENSVILLEEDQKTRYEGFDPNQPESYIIFEFMTDKYMDQSLEFASLVQNGFKNISRRKDRGVRQAGFLVLRESAMPSVLIELGFINNPDEAKYLSSTTGQRAMASAIYAGVEKYVKDFDKKRGETVITSSSRNDYPVASVREQEKTNGKNKPASEDKQPQPNRPEASSDPVFVSKNKDVTQLDIQTPQQPPREYLPPIVESQERVPEEPYGNVNVNVQTETETESAPFRSAANTTNQYRAIEYRVQFLISQRKLPAHSPQFKGLSPVSEYSHDGIYKYTYGSAADEESAIQIRDNIRAKFKDAFVVEFQNGVRIK